MKNLKYILSALLVALSICIPTMLTGCAFHCKVNVVVVAGSGDVMQRTVDNTNINRKSVVGENEVERGSDFLYAVSSSNADYEIWYVKENGVMIYNAENPGDYQLKPQDNYLQCNLENVKKDSKIEVAFRLKTYAVTFFYKNPSNEQGAPEYLQLTNADGSAYTKTALASTEIEAIVGLGEFGFKYYNQAGVLVDFDIQGNTITLRGDLALYTTKSLAELKALLGITD